VIAVHGGPAAVGEAAPIARGLAGSFRLLEPWQRGSGAEPLTVARHVADLDELVQSCGQGTRPALVGESWGAMLVLAYAAAHPPTGPLVLVGCGTFDPAARARLQAILEERIDEGLRRRLAGLPERSDTMFASDLSEGEVVRLLSLPQVAERLGTPAGGDLCALRQAAGRDTYRVTGPGLDLIVRLARDDMHLAALRKEERLQLALRGRVTLRLPDTTVFDGLAGCPAFAVHHTVPGEPLTSSMLARLTEGARSRLVRDLAGFFRELHGIPLEEACGWLGIPWPAEESLARLGKPAWFGADAIAAMRARLDALLGDAERGLFEDTVRRFQALAARPGYLVFGHGDVHGYNVAMLEDALGPRIAGVFDLGCAGILDVHEDLFRLSLVGEDLLERVIEAYQALPGAARELSRERIAVYYRAFLFYLLAEVPAEARAHLMTLLREHVRYHDATYVGLG
jgi:pimeloyl-ACP methyl ester carboxylesterase